MEAARSRAPDHRCPSSIVSEGRRRGPTRPHRGAPGAGGGARGGRAGPGQSPTHPTQGALRRGGARRVGGGEELAGVLALELDAERAVVVDGGEAAVDLGGLEDEAASFGEGDDRVEKVVACHTTLGLAFLEPGEATRRALRRLPDLQELIDEINEIKNEREDNLVSLNEKIRKQEMEEAEENRTAHLKLSGEINPEVDDEMDEDGEIEDTYLKEGFEILSEMVAYTMG